MTEQAACWTMPSSTNRKHDAAIILQDHKRLPARFFAVFSHKVLSRPV